MPIVVAVLLGMLALAFVLYPLYRRIPEKTPALATASPPQTSESAQTDSELAARKALQEVELDFQLGNLAETDYRSLRERYMHRALVALKVRHDREQEIDELIEEQLREMKEKRDGEGQDEH
jgi:hypothetical protein